MNERRKPEEFSPLGLYGNRDVFQRRLDEGFTKLAFGDGNWVGNERIVRLFVFYHPDGRIATYEHPKSEHDGTTFRGGPFEAEYSEEEFQSYKEKFQIAFGGKTSLAEVLEGWSE